jgi:TrmH family RNA methyltransferase
MKLLTLARDLKRRKAREKNALFVAEGVRAVEELLRSNLAIEGVLTAPQLEDVPRGASLRRELVSRAVMVAEVSELEFRSAAETESPQGVLAIARIPRHSFEAVEVGAHFRLLVLDAVQDPGNLGAILRTAAAFDVAATVALPGTVDLWNPKVVRAAMGAHFHHSSFHATTDHLFAFLERHSIELWGTETSGESILKASIPDRVALIVGNEGAGLSAGLRDRVQRTVSIPIGGKAESLNVAVATGIFLFELTK